MIWNKLESDANPYYATLKDPFNVQGVRIPDSINYPSATFSITKRVGITVPASGIAGIALGWYAISGDTNNSAHLVPVPNNTSSRSYAVGMVSGTGTTLNDVFGTVAGSAGTLLLLDQWQTGALTVPGLYSKVRLVSAGCAINSTASVTNLQGLWRAAFAPPNYYFDRVGSGANTVTFDAIGSIPGSVEVPVNTGKGVTVTYSPMDLDNLTYVHTGYNANGVYDVLEADVGSMFLVGSGLAASTALTVLITLNFEGIPQSNALNFIQVQPSFDDPLMLASALNKREEDFTAEPGTDAAQKVDKPEHPMYVDPLKDDERLSHHLTVVKVSSSGPKGDKISVRTHSQKGFLESIFKGFVPVMDSALERVTNRVDKSLQKLV